MAPGQGVTVRIFPSKVTDPEPPERPAPRPSGEVRRYAMRIGPVASVVFALMGFPARYDYIEVTEKTVVLRLGPTLRLSVARDDVLAASREPDTLFPSWGAFPTLGGGWAVQGASSGWVHLLFAEPQTGRWLGVFSLSCLQLDITLQEPDRFIDEFANEQVISPHARRRSRAAHMGRRTTRRAVHRRPKPLGPQPEATGG